ncbi:MAG: prepilin peptidase [Firmicutes bacterium]|nr:prepilin peptidase [Bacillota bacterium]
MIAETNYLDLFRPSVINHLFLFLCGLAVGSFLNVLIYRLPRGEKMGFSRSRCPSCGRRLSAVELIPLFSFLWLRGKCRHCRRAISLRYPFVEFLGGVVTVLWGMKFSGTTGKFIYLVLTYALIGVAFIDLEHKIIPNRLTIPFLLAGLVFMGWKGELPTALIGGVLGGGVLFLIALCYPKGMGMGDVKLLAMIGVYLGWQRIFFVLFLASLLATAVALVLIATKKMTRKDPIPFGTFLAVAAFIILYFPDLPGLFFPLVH